VKLDPVIQRELKKLERHRREVAERLEAEGWKPLFASEDWTRRGLALQMIVARLGCSPGQGEKILKEAISSGEVRVAQFKDEGQFSTPHDRLNTQDLNSWLDRHHPIANDQAPKPRRQPKEKMAKDAAMALWPETAGAPPDEMSNDDICKNVRKEVWNLEKVKVGEGAILIATGRKQRRKSRRAAQSWSRKA
jgi:hypothetical protein